jgi:ankyrin repeat protein
MLSQLDPTMLNKLEYALLSPLFLKSMDFGTTLSILKESIDICIHSLLFRLDLETQSMNLPPPPQSDDPIIAQFKPVYGQWELNDENINRIDPKTGYTILHNYCHHINSTPLEVYRYLIETLGSDINALNNGNDTPLHCALKNFYPNDGGDINVLTYLINQKNVNVNIAGSNTLLHWACKKINYLPIDMFKVLIETLGCDVNIQNIIDNTPLHYAFYHFNPRNGGDVTILTYLLSQVNVNGNIKGDCGYTLLQWACININTFPLDVFKLLIETIGCDINIKDDDNNVPLHLALHHFNPNDGGDIAVLHYLLHQENVNINIRGEDGYTLLHDAYDNINAFPIEIFKCLIETMGCDVNAQNDNGDTPLHCALENFNPNGGDINVLTYLINQKNVDVNINNIDDTASLHSACKNINRLSLDIFKCLIETMGSDVNAQNDNGDTPIHFALENFNPNKGGDINVLTYLINQKSVNVNIRGKRGHNLLHLTCFSYYRCSVELNGECDSILCQFVEMIAERCAQHILDEIS